MRYATRSAVALAVGLLACPALSPAADVDPKAQHTFDRLMQAVSKKDYAAFVDGATDAVKRGITPTTFTSVSRELAPHLDKGFTPAYLGDLNQHGMAVRLWKVVFKDGRDDALVSLSLQGDALAGFFVR